MIAGLPLMKVTKKQEAALLTAPLLEPVPMDGGWGVVVDVEDDDGESIERQYFTFGNREVADFFFGADSGPAPLINKGGRQK